MAHNIRNIGFYIFSDTVFQLGVIRASLVLGRKGLQFLNRYERKNLQFLNL